MSRSILFLLLLLIGLNGHASDDHRTESIDVGGMMRTFLIHVPRSLSGDAPVPLLIALHGGGGTGRHMVKLTRGGFDRLADAKGFVVVYPDGIGRHWNDGRSGVETGYHAHKADIDDVGFIAALIDHAIRVFNVDPQRVYVTGMSNGALMSYRLACELSERIAAVAPVTGNIARNLADSCTPAKPVAVLAINNRDDALVPFSGGHVTGPFGFRKLGQVLSVVDSVGLWVTYNQCSSVPRVVQEPDRDPGDGTLVRREVFGNCRDGKEVVLYAIEGGGHTWPMGLQYLSALIVGKTSRDIDANEVIWEFFQRHSLQ